MDEDLGLDPVKNFESYTAPNQEMIYMKLSEKLMKYISYKLISELKSQNYPKSMSALAMLATPNNKRAKSVMGRHSKLTDIDPGV